MLFLDHYSTIAEAEAIETCRATGTPLKVRGNRGPLVVTAVGRLLYLRLYFATCSQVGWGLPCIKRFCVIRDLKGFQLTHSLSPRIGFVKELLKMSQLNYPYLTDHCFFVNSEPCRETHCAASLGFPDIQNSYICNCFPPRTRSPHSAPWMFTIVWGVIKTALSAHTLTKIHILGSNYHEPLTTYVAPSSLPEDFHSKDYKASVKRISTAGKLAAVERGSVPGSGAASSMLSVSGSIGGDGGGGGDNSDADDSAISLLNPLKTVSDRAESGGPHNPEAAAEKQETSRSRRRSLGLSFKTKPKRRSKPLATVGRWKETPSRLCISLDRDFCGRTAARVETFVAALLTCFAHGGARSASVAA